VSPITELLVAASPYAQDVLPPLVKAVRENRETTLQSALILVGSKYAFETQISPICNEVCVTRNNVRRAVDGDSKTYTAGTSATEIALQVFAYGSMVFNLGGAIGGFVLIDILAEDI
jgi:hypothetical protein